LLRQEPEHHVRVDQAEPLVPECLRQGAHDSEATVPVQFDGRSVGAHDIIELHGREPLAARLVKAVLDKCTPDALSLYSRADQIGGAGNLYMPTTSPPATATWAAWAPNQCA
jgi:hypothetical protein